MAQQTSNRDSLIRHPYVAATPLPTDGRPVRILHPNYNEIDNILLQFLPFENDGVHYATVHVACGILVSNQWDCFLSTDREGQNRVELEPDDILESKEYYLQVPCKLRDDVHSGAQTDLIRDYAVTPTFDDWLFPHNSLPPNWLSALSFQESSSSGPNATICELTGRSYAIEKAHLVPKAESEWFTRNHMHLYTLRSMLHPTQSPRNVMSLQAQVHIMLDSKRLAVVPIQKRFVSYCFERDSKDFRDDLHRLEFQRHMSPDVCAFVFARFAYTVFGQVRIFLQGATKRQLRVRVKDTNKVTEKPCNASECQAYATKTGRQGKGRSLVTNKRPRSHEAEDPPEVYWMNEDDDWPSDAYYDGEGHMFFSSRLTDEDEDEDEDEEALRGRKRRH